MPGAVADDDQQCRVVHQNVRDLLGQGSYDTILQGSYKNVTALADMNDVDVLAICTDITKSGLGWFKSIPWKAVFANIETRLESDSRYAGKWNRHDKCITLETGVHLDIVPAVAKEDPGRDPIFIHSSQPMRTRRTGRDSTMIVVRPRMPSATPTSSRRPPLQALGTMPLRGP